MRKSVFPLWEAELFSFSVDFSLLEIRLQPQELYLLAQIQNFGSACCLQNSFTASECCSKSTSALKRQVGTISPFNLYFFYHLLSFQLCYVNTKISTETTEIALVKILDLTNKIQKHLNALKPYFLLAVCTGGVN